MQSFLIFFTFFTLFLVCLIVHASLHKENIFLDKLTSKLGVISGFFITAALYLTYLIYKSNINTTKKDITYKIIDRGWININKQFVEHYNLCPNFIDSLYFEWQESTNFSSNLNKNELDSELNLSRGIYTHKNRGQTNPNDDKWYAVNFLSILIFQSFEDFLTSLELDETGDYVWICNYIQWASSPMLENKWSVLKSNYADTTIILGDILFNNVRNVQIKDTNDIREVANKIINSDEYRLLVKKRNHDTSLF